MNARVTLSSKGQVVIPKDVRDALGWPEGQQLVIRKAGDRAIIEPLEAPRERIDYAEFRRRLPKYRGPPVALDDMDLAIEEMWRQRARRDD